MKTQNSPKKILIAIPCYNCEKQIPRVLSTINKDLASRVEEIAVIDNGSTDNTVNAALSMKKLPAIKSKLHVYFGLLVY